MVVNDKDNFECLYHKKMVNKNKLKQLAQAEQKLTNTLKMRG
jgi:hypothetical protein